MQLPSLPTAIVSSFHQSNSSSEILKATASVIPAVASTACCWGPAVLSVFGATSSTALAHVTKFRPYLLTLSACMISLSFYRVYGPPSRQEHACCKTPNARAKHEKTLRVNRLIAWASLGVAIAGASSGRIAFPKAVMSPFGNGTFGTKMAVAGARAAAAAGEKVGAAWSVNVQGMHCGGCASKVRNAIESVSGVTNVVVDHETGAVAVQWMHSHEVSKETIKTAVASVGYVVGGKV